MTRQVDGATGCNSNRMVEPIPAAPNCTLMEFCSYDGDEVPVPLPVPANG
jgi:hypothetical protein